MSRLGICVLIIVARAVAGEQPAPITIDYPADGSIFPPEMTAPAPLWRDAAEAATVWRIEVRFADGSAPIQAETQGERVRLGEIDPRTIAETNELPKLTPQEAAAWSWRPDAETWAAIKKHSVGRPATVTISGFQDATSVEPLSRGRVTIQTSKDPVGAPIFCHFFSRDGKTLGMDVDGPQNDNGMYAIVPVRPEMSIRNEDVFSWNSFPDKPPGHRTIGFMAQISPDGEYAVTTLNGAMYVANFKDYRLLQVFYPTRGILAWYSRATGRMRALPGADNPSYVQTDAVWSPDGRYLVFARAPAKDPYPEGRKLAEYAGDPNETPIRYDLYRIPFNAGKGGRPEAIAGASRNGMSNSFPKISPNGRWMVFSSKSHSPYTEMFLTHLDEEGNDSPAIRIENATAANRAVNLPEFVNIPPDGLRKIDVPAAESYRLFDRAWQLAEKGQYDASVAEWRKALEISPEDAKARNNLGRALAGKGEFEEAIRHWQKALEVKPDYAEARNNLGVALMRKGRWDEAIAQFRKVLEVNPNYAEVNTNLGRALAQKGRLEEAIAHWRKALELNPDYAEAHNDLGTGLFRKAKLDEAMAQWRKAVEVYPGFAQAHFNLGNALSVRGQVAEALGHWRAGLRVEANHVAVLRQAAWALATAPEASVRNGTEAVALAERAVQLSGGRDPAILDTLGAAYAEAGRFGEAVETARRAMALAAEQNQPALREALKGRISLYEAKRPFRETRRRP